MPHIYAYTLHCIVFVVVACSKRSDSGERCVRAPFTSHRSPLSERLEQAIVVAVVIVVPVVAVFTVVTVFTNVAVVAVVSVVTVVTVVGQP